jgi:tight adherence protein C
MSNELAFNIFLALLASVGVWLLLSGLTGSLFQRGESTQRMEPLLGRKADRQLIVSDLPPLAQRLLAQLLTDLGASAFRKADQAGIEDRLRRAGWPYVSVGDYHGSKVLWGVLLLILGVVVSVFLNLPTLLIALLAAGLGFGGLYLPDIKIRRLTEERRQALFREMAWTIDRMATVMKTGEAFESSLNRLTGNELAWVAGGSGGLFIALLRDIAAGLSAKPHDIREMLDEVRRTLPLGMPEVDEFLQAVQVNIEKRQPITDQLRALGRTMRDQLNNRIDEVAQAAALKVVVLISGVIVPSLLIVILGPALFEAFKAFG